MILLQARALQASPATSAPNRTLDGTPGPAAIYEGLTNQRNLLNEQLSGLESERDALNNQIQRGNVQGASRIGVESRIAEIDKRISDVEKQIAQVDAQRASAAAVPGAIVVRPREMIVRNGPPEEAYFLGGMFMILVFFPLSVAIARRIWKQASRTVAAIPSDLMNRLARIENAVEASAVEIERIGEGQRFITKLFGDAKQKIALPAGESSSQGKAP